MKPFMDPDFLLTTETAKSLYHDCAKKIPVLDYHCHINPQEIADDRRFDNITQLWLGGDHYKWRQMRWAGVDEYYITGGASDREKFQKWAETLPLLIGNPLYHWSHLELQRYFNFHKPLCGATAQEAWDLCGQKLAQTSARLLIQESSVTLLCTTDDPADSLEAHRQIAQDKLFPAQVLPAWRPEAAMELDAPGFCGYLQRLGEASGMKIGSYADLQEALRRRMALFAARGCRTADHSLDYVMYCPASDQAIEGIFQKALAGGAVSKEEKYQYLTAFMLFAGAEYRKLDWVMQIHYGVIRNGNTRMFRQLGANAGFDSISNETPARPLVQFLDALCVTGSLPRTVLYSLNPGDFTTMGSIIGSYQDGEVPGKLQIGSGWWFHDSKTGMQEQMISLANQGALGTFIGMLTDSRSFISYPRHEYFRRILCELIGGWVENGEYPNDREMLHTLVRKICYNNAVRYFDFPLESADSPL